VVEIAPTSGLAARSLANAYRLSERYNDAIRWFETSIKLDPNLVGAHNGLGNCHRETGNFAAAIAVYQNALALDPSSAEILYNLAIVHVDMGRFDDALAIAEQALKEQPDAAWAHLARGKALAVKRVTKKHWQHTRKESNSIPPMSAASCCWLE
jgi:protein O-GlcNAc transferase